MSTTRSTPSHVHLALVRPWIAVALSALVGCGGPDEGYSTTSCEYDAVRAAIDAAADGDVIRLPPGTCTWTQSMTVDLTTPPRALTIQGAGEGQTTIVDGIAAPAWDGILWAITTVDGKPFRLSGFSFRTDPALESQAPKGAAVIHINGTAKSFRIDHNRFETTQATGRGIIATGFLFGVIDHNTFEEGVGQGVAIFHEAWGGQQGGHGSWAAPLSFGTEEAIYIEDNVFRNQLVTDGFNGARYVVRHNEIATQGIPVQNHGVEGATRSTFSMEVYDNTVTLPPTSTLFYLRGGTAVIYGNTITEPSGLTATLGNFINFRSIDTRADYDGCYGTGPYDDNDTSDGPETPGGAGDGVFASGTHTGESVTEAQGSPAVLTSDQTWEVDQWVGYSLYNATRDWGSQIQSNTENTITTDPSAHIGDTRVPPHEWQAGDAFEVRRVRSCLDQIGRGTGVLLTGAPPPYGDGIVPTGWPNQAIEPVYAWDNTVNGAPLNTMSSAYYVVQAGRDYLEGMARPGYTPFTYPHPLVE